MSESQMVEYDFFNNEKYITNIFCIEIPNTLLLHSALVSSTGLISSFPDRSKLYVIWLLTISPWYQIVEFCNIIYIFWKQLIFSSVSHHLICVVVFNNYSFRLLPFWWSIDSWGADYQDESKRVYGKRNSSNNDWGIFLMLLLITFVMFIINFYFLIK